MTNNNETIVEYNLLHPDTLTNPYPTYHRLRVNDPVHWSENIKSWVLTRYDDVVSGLRDPRLSVRRDNTYMGMLPEDVQQELQPLRRFFSLWMVFSDPPAHTRIRGLVNKAFVPRVVAGMKPYIQRIVDELLDVVQHSGHMDVLYNLAYPLPIVVIAEMLGVQPEDREQFKKWSDDIVAFMGTGQPIPDRGRRAQQSMLELMDYFHTTVERRRKNPKDDLLTALISVADQSDTLSEEELFATCANLLIGGHEPTTNLIGNGLLALLRNIDQLQKLQNSPSLIELAVDEFLRYDCPFQYAARRAKEDIKIDGRLIAQNQRVLLMLAAANRDPSRFPDPDRLDISRKENAHLAFGFGNHFCLGASLAKAEAQIAINTILRRMPTLQLASENIEWRQDLGFRGLTSLPIVF